MSHGTTNCGTHLVQGTKCHASSQAFGIEVLPCLKIYLERLMFVSTFGNGKAVDARGNESVGNRKASPCAKMSGVHAIRDFFKNTGALVSNVIRELTERRTTAQSPGGADASATALCRPRTPAW